MSDVYVVLAVLFAILKLVGVFKSSWLWVLSPIWIPFLARLAVCVLYTGVLL